mmetsp:Transcript_72338/g.221528  ORF Transcript_72338/g.221528 Transcript_72338/m.221528 type:complete len:230 (+) Transcript_72338:132-821(+)
MRSSMICCFSETSSRTIATWMLFSSLASASIWRRWSISSLKCSFSKSLAPGPEMGKTSGSPPSWAASGGERSGFARCSPGSAGGEAASEDDEGAEGKEGAEGADGRPSMRLPLTPGGAGSSATSHSPKSMRLTTFSCLLPALESAPCGALSNRAWCSVSEVNILNPMSSSSELSPVSARCVPSKSHSSSTAWALFFLASSSALALAFTSSAARALSSATLFRACTKPCK